LLHDLGDVDATVQARLPWARAFKEGVLPFAAGGVLLVVLVLARYALAGELGTFFFWSVTFNAKNYMGPYKGRILLQMWQWFVHDGRALLCVLLALIVMIVPAAGRLQSVSVRGVLRALRASGFEVVVGLMMLTVLFAAVYPLRIWQHYFVPVWPFVGLLFGIAIEGVVVRQAVRPRLARAAAALLCGGLVAVSGIQRFGEIYLRRSQGEWPDPRRDPACAEIDRIAGPGKDGIFIWGTIGDLYVSCRRRSVSKFTYTTIIAGIIPPFWNQPDPKNIAPGSRETLLAELAAHRPPVIIDFPISPGNAMVNIPELRAVLDERYCRASFKRDLHGRELTFFARRDLPACAGK
jgi:hypothetical protein